LVIAILDTSSLFVWLVADGLRWFLLIEKYCWPVADGWFILREKYCWLVADKPKQGPPSKQAQALTSVSTQKKKSAKR
jgi:hypothetical protein